jgi:hypothetical protein
LPRKRLNSADSAPRDCLMSSSKRARRLGLGLMSGFVTAAELSGAPRLKRRLSLWAPPRHRPDTPWRNTLMSSPRAVKRPAVDFVGFVIWETSKSLKTRSVYHVTAPGPPPYATLRCLLRIRGTTTITRHFGPTRTAVAGLSSDLIGCAPPRGSLTARRYDMLMLRVRGERIAWHAPPIAGAR